MPSHIELLMMCQRDYARHALQLIWVVCDSYHIISRELNINACATAVGGATFSEWAQANKAKY